MDSIVLFVAQNLGGIVIFSAITVISLMTVWALNVSNFWPPAVIAAVIAGAICFVPGMWWFIFFAMILDFCIVGAVRVSQTAWKVFFSILTVVLAIGGLVVFSPIMQAQLTPESVTVTAIVTQEEPPVEEPICVDAEETVVVSEPVETPVPVAEVTPEPTEDPTVCKMAIDLGFRTGGQVENNLDDGDAVMGTILLVTKDQPSTQPVLFVILPGSSIDIEYEGQMFFTSDRFKGTLSEAVCLAESLHPEIANKIVIGEDGALPEGWQQLDNVDGWWTSSIWLYQESPIMPEGLTASEGIFVSKVQTNRDLVAKEGEVIYGQFWKTVGTVDHTQVRWGQTLTVPSGYQGTYWIWTGDFNLGEKDLQKRILQATFQEVVNRDDVLKVNLVSCGPLPEVDESLLKFSFRDNDVTWVTSLAGWSCKVTE